MEALTSSSSQNKDLAWSLQYISQKEKGRDFILKLSKYLPAYSPSVRQLYSKYECHFTSLDLMHIIPCQYSFDQVFSHIDSESVVDTPLELIPTSSGIVFVDRRKPKGQNIIELKKGLLSIVASFNTESPFIPVIQKGDLREFKSSLPLIHLHKLNINACEDISMFSKQLMISHFKLQMVKLYRAEMPMNPTL